MSGLTKLTKTALAAMTIAFLCAASASAKAPVSLNLASKANKASVSAKHNAPKIGWYNGNCREFLV